MKKKLTIALLLLVLVLSLAFAACQPEECQHNFVDGVCTECDEPDPDYSAPPSYVLPNNYPQTASEPSIMLHYKRSDEQTYLTWGFWIWTVNGGEGQLFNLNYQDDYGAIALYPLSAFGATETSTIGIIPRLQADWVKDVDADRMLDLSTLTKDANNYIHVYLAEGDGDLYTNPTDIKYAATATFNTATSILINAKSAIKTVTILADDETFLEQDGGSKTRVEIALPAEKQNIDVSKKYTAKVLYDDDYSLTVNVGIVRVLSSDAFAQNYHYDGELGAIYSKEETTFRVWSPMSTKIVLNLYQNGDGAETPQSTEMVKGEKGVFEVTLKKDLGGMYYTYTVFNYNYPNGMEIVDPYAKSAGLSGTRGQIVDFSQTNPDGWDSVTPHAYDRKELVVWETHVADVTSSETWTGNEQYRKTFLGMVQSGTTYSEGDTTVKTGFDHIVELGVNAVQLVPVFDQANDEANMTFNWGYNPLNYNVLEGGYSTDASDGYVRIREFKQLVQAFNGAGINIIMDVVYNHVNSANNSNFDVLMPGYYFRYTSDGSLYNGSGCGNETASDNSMFRKFMIDSVCFWAEEYKLGGFRFDLMGLHDVETMSLLVDALEVVNPNIVVYGEPWTGGTSGLSQNLQAVQSNGAKFDGFGQFNDQMRDALIKSGMNAATQKGWITNASLVNSSDVKKIVQGMQGITNTFTLTDPNKTVNYVTCHDNYTLYDRIKAAGITDEETVKKMAMLANAVVFTSNGTTFMLAGEEMLRTKNVDGATADEVHNSYQSSYKVNELNYALKIAHADLFENYRKLIQFKIDCSGLHLEEDQIADNYIVEQLADGSALQLLINAGDKVYTVIHANGTLKGLTVDLAGQTLYLDTLGQLSELTAETPVLPYQTIIAYRTVEGA